MTVEREYFRNFVDEADIKSKQANDDSENNDYFLKYRGKFVKLVFDRAEATPFEKKMAEVIKQNLEIDSE